MVFKSKVPGAIASLRVYGSILETKKIHEARIWRNKDNTVVAGPFKWEFGGEDDWVTLDIPDLAVEADTEYTVAIATSDEAAYAYRNRTVCGGATQASP